MVDTNARYTNLCLGCFFMVLGVFMSDARWGIMYSVLSYMIFLGMPIVRLSLSWMVSLVP